jgi:hypothetical protein
LRSAQEFSRCRILGCLLFLDEDEFGLGHGHPLGLEKQIARIPLQIFRQPIQLVSAESPCRQLTLSKAIK